ncbi:MAG TPA: response regulator transcription factor, partial [Coriobacteriia bacterium]|nr:response regulator transcription factor [Coriobacteriia bacterium]
VVIVDDHALVRNAVRLALEPDSRIEIVGEARSGAEAISTVRATAPDVVVMDFRLGDADAPEVIDRLREQGSKAEIVILTSYGDRRNVRAAIDRGARAFLTKRATDIDRLARAVLDAHAGKATLSEDALSELMNSVRDQDLPFKSEITPRAREVWRLVALGESNAKIASDLFVSERTVKYHVSNLLAATSARTRAELVGLAYRSGLMDTEE